MFGYKFEGGEYTFMDGDRAITPPCRELAFLVDTSGAVLHKHGALDKVELIFRSYVEKYAQAGLYDIANDLLVINVTGMDLDEINKCLNITGYVRYVIEKHTNTCWPRIHEDMTEEEIRRTKGMILARRNARQDQMKLLVQEERYEAAAKARDAIIEWNRILTDLDNIRSSRSVAVK